MALHYIAAREALAAGDRLMVTHPLADKPDTRTTYGLVRAGKAVTSVAFRKLRPDLRPVADGLFGESQTYELAPK